MGVYLEVEKGAPAKVFEGAEIEDHGEWQTLDAKEAFKITEALSDPLRQWVYHELEKGAFRQAELAKRATAFFKKKITSVLMRYHLQHLKKVGLVKFERDPRAKRAKVIHLALELRLQTRPFYPHGELSSGELGEELLKIFKKRAKGT